VHHEEAAILTKADLNLKVLFQMKESEVQSLWKKNWSENIFDEDWCEISEMIEKPMWWEWMNRKEKVAGTETEKRWRKRERWY
jgi:hypothetical protein